MINYANGWNNGHNDLFFYLHHQFLILGLTIIIIKPLIGKIYYLTNVTSKGSLFFYIRTFWKHLVPIVPI